MKNIIKNKKGLVFKNLFFALIFVSMTIIGVGLWINTWEDKYNVNLNYNLEQDYNKLNELSTVAGSQQDKVKINNPDITGGAEEFDATSIRGVFGILNNIFQPFRILFYGEGSMLDSLNVRFGLPSFMMQGIVTMIILSIIFSLIVIFFRVPKATV